MRSGSACLSAGEPAYRPSGSYCKYPALTGRSGTQRHIVEVARNGRYLVALILLTP
jgi:hypothetical protein